MLMSMTIPSNRAAAIVPNMLPVPPRTDAERIIRMFAHPAVDSMPPLLMAIIVPAIAASAELMNHTTLETVRTGIPRTLAKLGLDAAARIQRPRRVRPRNDLSPSIDARGKVVMIRSLGDILSESGFAPKPLVATATMNKLKLVKVIK